MLPCITKDLREEAPRLLHLAAPMVLQTLISCALGLIGSAMVGHLNDPAMLSGFVLANSSFNTLGFSAILGITTALDTLCGQAYGAKNFRLLGLSLQRCILILSCLCCIIAAVFSMSESLLIFLGQLPLVAHYASVVLLHIIPSLFLTAVSTSINRYLMAQQMVKTALLAAAGQVLLAPVPYYVLVHRMDLGLVGAAWAFNIVSGLYTLILLLCIVWHTVYCEDPLERAWCGWSWEAWTAWGQFMSLGLPGCAMACLEWWTFEIIIFLSGLVPNGAVAQGATGITMQLCYWMYSFPSGLGSAAGVLVANAVGAGQAGAAKRAFITAVVMVGLGQLLVVVLYLTALPQMGWLFTENESVRGMVRELVPLLALAAFADGGLSVLLAVMRGLGHQRTGSLLALLCCWGLAIPSMVLLAFTAGLGAKGFLMGLALALNVELALAGIWAARLDWQQEVGRSKKLMGTIEEEEDVQLLATCKSKEDSVKQAELASLIVDDLRDTKSRHDKTNLRQFGVVLAGVSDLARGNFTLGDDDKENNARSDAGRGNS